MSLEYEGQTINSMKWNGQEILGGSGNGGIETLTEIAYFPTYQNKTWEPVQMNYVRFYSPEEDVYRVALYLVPVNNNFYAYFTSYTETTFVAKTSSGSNKNNNATKYVIPEGFRPASNGLILMDFSNYTTDGHCNIRYKNNVIDIYSTMSSSSLTCMVSGDITTCTCCYKCDYTGE